MPVWKTWYWRLQNLNFPNHLILGTTLESDSFYFSRLWGKLGTPEQDHMKCIQGESRLHNSQAHYAKVCHPIFWWEGIITTTSLLRTSRDNGHQLGTVSSLPLHIVYFDHMLYPPQLLHDPPHLNIHPILCLSLSRKKEEKSNQTNKKQWNETHKKHEVHLILTNY